jgi:hypothetical protein
VRVGRKLRIPENIIGEQVSGDFHGVPVLVPTVRAGLFL